MANAVTNFAGRKLAETFLYPPEQPFPKTPADYGIGYVDVEFPARDGLILSAWLLNGGQDTAIVMTHFGYRANRFGYQTTHQPRLTRPYKREIEFVRVARHLVDAGYTVLMYDMRNHGASAKNATGCGTGGVEERYDVLGAIEYVASLDGVERIGLLSYCMGANATFFAAGEDARAFIDGKVKALVAMQPLRNGDFIHAMGGIPERLYDEAEAHFTARTGCSLNPEIMNEIAQVPVPTLLLQGRKDPWTNLDFINQTFATLGRDANHGAGIDKEMEWLEGTEHRFDGYNWFADHPESMLRWFQTHLYASQPE